jgi:hypothetical protein
VARSIAASPVPAGGASRSTIAARSGSATRPASVACAAIRLPDTSNVRPSTGQHSAESHRYDQYRSPVTRMISVTSMSSASSASRTSRASGVTRSGAP